MLWAVAYLPSSQRLQNSFYHAMYRYNKGNLQPQGSLFSDPDTLELMLSRPACWKAGTGLLKAAFPIWGGGTQLSPSVHGALGPILSMSGWGGALHSTGAYGKGLVFKKA